MGGPEQAEAGRAAHYGTPTQPVADEIVGHVIPLEAEPARGVPPMLSREPMTLLLLRTGRLAVDLAPAAGGSLARFSCGDFDVLRPMTAKAAVSGKGNQAALYPLVPYSNRIRD